jgi:phenylacetate-coenzyme A ligase PaaK-like adenylate-forming protein
MATAPTAPWAAAAQAAGWWLRLTQTWAHRLAGAGPIAHVAGVRLDGIVAYAREHSPLYRDAYRDLASAPALADLPVMTRQQLMGDFDRWATDRRVTRAAVETFLGDRDSVGARLLGRYTAWKSSGSSGEPGVYVQDDDALAVYDALIAVQLTRPDLAAQCFGGLMSRGGRAALVAATGDHFASIASWERVCRAAPRVAAKGFSILSPLDRLVTDLDRFAPAFIASYPTMLSLLAEERIAGRLATAPSLVWSGGETLSAAAHRALQDAFACPVVNEYGASECLSIAFSCREGALHVNADWVIVEAVDAQNRPVANGTASHSVLITNLANRVQPIIRYDLGDSVRMRDGRCACGSDLPALEVQGRCDEVLVLPGRGGARRILPMALTTVIEEASGVHRFQVVHDGARTLRLRMPHGPAGERAHAFDDASRATARFLAEQGCDPVDLRLDAGEPTLDARTGKLRQVIVER